MLNLISVLVTISVALLCCGKEKTPVVHSPPRAITQALSTLDCIDSARGFASYGPTWVRAWPLTQYSTEDLLEECDRSLQAVTGGEIRSLGYVSWNAKEDCSKRKLASSDSCIVLLEKDPHASLEAADSASRPGFFHHVVWQKGKQSDPACLQHLHGICPGNGANAQEAVLEEGSEYWIGVEPEPKAAL